jgi:hypothetical protein
VGVSFKRAGTALVGTYVEQPIVEAIDKQCGERGRSQWLRNAIEEHLRRQQQEADNG